ncbi:hypothetical protein [Evansella cellulosilytica]|uniref:Uncharacterized protein n=1 Tax=Evansella cellulosilytica (strain ATCC 21833 / DSM 2522 / FERM P-1141 / JCM 9156 / N-4) TaxID=649639 RepID=E6TXN1_EVAC2|nr:hypothetical protein [Evansella cellulosilytica]ADU29957.1 hypothetical protein Bcell_1694 [Evansella cellulosilytica DSM 2522]
MGVATIIFPSIFPLFVLLILICTSLVYWTKGRRIGFQLLYLTFLSICISYIILLNIPLFYTHQAYVPFTDPIVQTVVTIFLFFIPLCQSKKQITICLLLPIFFCIYSIVILQAPPISVVSGIIIGGFLVYTFYRTLDWIEGMPERLLLLFSIIFPLFLAIIIFPNIEHLFYPGILLGSAIGITVETLKVKVNNIPRSTTRMLFSVSLGTIGLIILYLMYMYTSSFIPMQEWISGLVIGIWVTLIVPYILSFLKNL